MKDKRKQLQALDKETLIEGYLLLGARVRSLEQEVRDLRKLLDGSETVPPKTPDNSSLSSSKSPKASTKTKPRAKRGPKVGHEGKSRQRKEPDEIIEYRVEGYCECGHDLSTMSQHEVGRHQVVDIPPISPIVREVVRYGGYCSNCGHYHRRQAPEGFERGRVFGTNLEKLVIYLHHAHPLSYERVQKILQDLCGLEISKGALVNLVKRNADPLQQSASHIQKNIQQASVIGSDETGVRVDGENQWQWVFQNDDWVYMLIHPRRNGAVVHEAMGDATPDVWVSDLGSAQLQHPASEFQVCLAHQVRDLQYAIDVHRCAWSYHLQHLFYRAMRLGKHRKTLPSDIFERQVDDIEAQLDVYLSIYPQHEASKKLWRRYNKHRDHLLTFLHHAGVPPTNNASEQALRNSVIYRKVTGGFRTNWGAVLYANVISILETARRQKRNIYETLSSILAGHPIFLPIGE